MPVVRSLFVLFPQGTSFKAWQSWTFPGSTFNTFSNRSAKVLDSFLLTFFLRLSSKDPPFISTRMKDLPSLYCHLAKMCHLKEMNIRFRSFLPCPKATLKHMDPNVMSYLLKEYLIMSF